MYVTPVVIDDKYYYFDEGTYVQQIENKGTAAAPIYEVTFNQNVKAGGTIDLAFRNGTWHYDS